jgi:hypothetical protein
MRHVTELAIVENWVSFICNQANSPQDDGMTNKQPEDATEAKQNEQIQQLQRNVGFAWITAALGPLLALGGVVFSGLQWKAADRQLEVAASQLKDAREGADQARKDTVQALRIAESQAISLRTLANAGSVASDVAHRQLRVMERQAVLMQEQLSGSKATAVQTAKSVDRQLGLAEVQATSMQQLAYATADVAETSKATIDTSRRTLAVLQETLRRDQAQVTLALYHHIGVGIGAADAGPDGWVRSVYVNVHIFEAKAAVSTISKMRSSTAPTAAPSIIVSKSVRHSYVLNVTNNGNRPIRLIRLWITGTPTDDNPWIVTRQYNFEQLLSEQNRRVSLAFDPSALPSGYLVSHIEIEGDGGEKFFIREAQAELVDGWSRPES